MLFNARLFSFALPFLLIATVAPAQEVVVLTYEGPIGTLSAEYIERGLEEAEQRHAEALILRLDTPGGLDSSMRRIIRGMMNSPVPVVIYVAPRGARAASAGCLITLAAAVAAMAPGTNLGAAHPIDLGGGAVSEKVLNDAVAYARSLATANKRNIDWAEKAVRESASLSQGEAVQQGVVDFSAEDLNDLLKQLDGRRVRTATGETVLHTLAARPVWLAMNWREQALKTLTDPTLAYLLLLLGILAIVFEVVTPGGFLAGTFGVLAVMLALAGLVNLPVQASGAALLLLGMVFFVLELKITSQGLLSLAGMIAFIFGSMLLLPRVPGYRISWMAIGGVALAWGGVSAVVVRLVLRAHRRPVQAGVESLVGAEGVAKTALTPRGIVHIEGEDWNAEAAPPPVAAGEKVRVIEIRGLILQVGPIGNERRR